MYGAAWATTIAYAMEALAAFALAQRIFALPYSALEILAGMAVACGALCLTQFSWMPVWRAPVLVLSVVIALGLLALIGRRDLQSGFIALQNARKK